MAKGRRGGVTAIILIGLFVVILGGVGAWMFLSAREDRRAVAVAWNNLSQCLIGEPLRAGEKPSERFHAIELVAATLPKGKAELEQGRDVWPSRCTANAQVLKRALVAAGASSGDRRLLAERLDGIAGVAAYAPQALDDVWEAAAKVPLVASPTSDEPPPPQVSPHAPLTAQLLANAGPFISGGALSSLQISHDYGGVAHVLFLKTQLEPWLCTVDATSARCGALPPGIEGGHTYGLAGSAEEGAAPLVVVTADGKDSVHRSDTGEVVGTGFNHGALAAKDGFAVALSGGDRSSSRKYTLYRQRRGQAADSVTWARPKGQEYGPSPILYAGRLFYVASNDANTSMLQARTVPPEGELGPVEQVGPSRAGPTQGCRTEQATFVYADKFVSVFAGGAWSKPVGTAFADGWIACEGDTSTLARFRDDDVELQRCTARSCDEIETIPVKHFSRADVPQKHVVAMLGDRLLVAWSDARGVVLFRVAPPKALKDAPTHVLFDPFAQEGRIEDAAMKLKVRMVARAGFALAFLELGGRVHAARILPDGSFAPVALAPAGAPSPKAP